MSGNNSGPMGSKLDTLTNKIAFLGDSRCATGEGNYFKLAATSDTKGISIVMKGTGIGCTTNANGTLEYRAYDKSFRWTAPSDTAGVWTPIVRSGDITIQSGSTDKWLLVMLRSVLTLPTTDQTITVTLSGSMIKYVGAVPTMTMQVMSYFRFNQAYQALGCSQATTREGVELLPYWKEVAGEKGGIDVIRMGTNDGFAVSETISNMTTIFNARLALGRKLVICGESPKWGTAVGTPATLVDIIRVAAISKAYKDFCNSNPSTCKFVDLLALGQDPAYKDYRPVAGILKDVVHDNHGGAMIFGNAIAKAVESFGIQGKDIFPQRGNPNNLLASGYMTGSVAQAGTGASGVAPTGVSVSRGSGSDATVVCSVFTQTVPYATTGLQMDVTSITSGNIIKATLAAGTTLSSLNLAVGDTLELRCDCELTANTTGATDIAVMLYFNDPLLIRTQINVPLIVGYNKNFRSCPIKIPTGATNLSVQAWVTTGSNGTASVKLSDVELFKVS